MGRQRVMVADDEAVVRRVLERSLSAPDRELILAADGDEALALARVEVPDVLLLDVDMPGKNGWEVLKALREDEATRGISVILISGNEDALKLLAAVGLTSGDFIAKPFSVVEVRARVDKALDSRSLPCARISP